MAYNSLLGTEKAALVTSGRDAATLGPSDSSDSGSDMMGVEDSEATTPGILPDTPRDGADIGVDRVFTPGQREIDADEPIDAQPGGATDEDPDLAFLDVSQAGDPLDEEDPAEVDEATWAGEVKRLEAQRTAGIAVRAATTLPGMQPNPEPDPPEPLVPANDDEVDESEPVDDDDHRPGRASGARMVSSARAARSTPPSPV